jgi:hypothetical protein
MNNLKIVFCDNKMKEEFTIAFKKCVTGYHLMNASPINETVWEDLNELILTACGVEVMNKSNGSHCPGMDINCSLGRLSNKSAKYDAKKNISISSYRLTTVCSDRKCGITEDIIKEIQKRKNFDYYSCIIRDENKENNIIKYDWLMIPSNYKIMDPSSYDWIPTIGQKGDKKDTQVGWHTNEINGSKMRIVFSMSSQLWIDIIMTYELREFIIASTEVSNTPKLNYLQLVDILQLK